jgi:hypothetical protein
MKAILLRALFSLFMAVTFTAHPLVHRVIGQTPKHGGQIEAKYDGYSFETIVTLRRMKVVCGNSKTTESGMKGLCVNIAASLHSPGQQLEYVKYVKLQLVFDNKDWVTPHPLGQRELVAVVDNESLRLGTMQLAKQNMDSDRGVDVMQEVLEVSIPYQAFKKIASGNVVEMKVGTTAFGLKEKNLAALRDLKSRIKTTTARVQD